MRTGIKRAAGIIILIVTFSMTLGGCSALGSVGTEPETIINGTTAGNIVNKGFAVKDGDDLYFYFTGGSEYETGDIVRSNPETGENSLAMHDGGLYMSIYGGYLYYCREDGIYRASMETFENELLLEGQASQLQIGDDNMFFLKDGSVLGADSDGKDTGFTPIANAGCLTLYQNKLFYIDANSGQVWQADTDGTGAELLFDLNVKQFCILEGVFYYLDNADGFIKRVTVKDPQPETVVSYACSSFNINLYGMYYTREVDGKNVCCNADIDGKNEQIIENNEAITRHLICLFNSGAVILPEEEFEKAAS